MEHIKNLIKSINDPKRYFESKRNTDIFIRKNRLNNINNIEKVIEQIVIDQSNKIFSLSEYIKEDFKFTNLNMCLYQNIEGPTLEYEKVLADLYDTNLSNIDILDKNRFLFEITDWNTKFKSVIYHNDDLDIIYNNLIDYSFNKIGKQTVNVLNNEIELKNIIDKEKFIEKMGALFSKDDILKIISDSIELKFYKEHNGYYIWSNKI
jgi:hypothetical protein